MLVSVNIGGNNGGLLVLELTDHIVQAISGSKLRSLVHSAFKASFIVPL